MSIIIEGAETSYRLTQQQLIDVIAADMKVAPQHIDVVFHVENIGDAMDRNPQPTFTGCTVRMRVKR